MNASEKRLVKGGHKALIHPQFVKMSQQDRLLRAVMIAYAKHHLESPHIGWEGVSDVLYNEICNTIGDDAFIAWGDKIKEENGQPDL